MAGCPTIDRWARSRYSAVGMTAELVPGSSLSSRCRSPSKQAIVELVVPKSIPTPSRAPVSPIASLPAREAEASVNEDEFGSYFLIPGVRYNGLKGAG